MLASLPGAANQFPRTTQRQISRLERTHSEFIVSLNGDHVNIRLNHRNHVYQDRCADSGFHIFAEPVDDHLQNVRW